MADENMSNKSGTGEAKASRPDSERTAARTKKAKPVRESVVGSEAVSPRQPAEAGQASDEPSSSQKLRMLFEDADPAVRSKQRKKPGKAGKAAAEGGEEAGMEGKKAGKEGRKAGKEGRKAGKEGRKAGKEGKKEGGKKAGREGGEDGKKARKEARRKEGGPEQETTTQDSKT